MATDVIENNPSPPEPTSDPVDNAIEIVEQAGPPGDVVSSDEAVSTRDAAAGLAIYTAGAALSTLGSAFRLAGRIGGALLTPVNRVYKSSPLEPVRSHFDKLIERGEAEVDEWIETGQAQEAKTIETAKKIADPFVDVVVGYLSTHPAIQKLIKDQIDALAQESREMPQINVLVRVLADNYITYLNENPEQVKALIQNQAEDFIDHLAENPKQVQDLVQGQSVSMINEITDEVREQTVTADSALESLVRRLFRRRPRSVLPEPPPEVQRRALQARLPEDFPRLEAMRNDEQQP